MFFHPAELSGLTNCGFLAWRLISCSSLRHVSNRRAGGSAWLLRSLAIVWTVAMETTGSTSYRQGQVWLSYLPFALQGNDDRRKKREERSWTEVSPSVTVHYYPYRHRYRAIVIVIFVVIAITIVIVIVIISIIIVIVVIFFVIIITINITIIIIIIEQLYLICCVCFQKVFTARQNCNRKTKKQENNFDSTWFNSWKVEN